MNPGDKYLPIQVSVHFRSKLQEANEFLDYPIVVSSAIDELRDKQHFFETSVVAKVIRLNNPRHWLLRDLSLINVFQYTFFPINCSRHCNNTTN